ncbi:MAG: DEAD/DEAH box helicase [Desulfobacterium sp.]|nr:DEAD/DEAH box helicase [Desulfobacterium sp.]
MAQKRTPLLQLPNTFRPFYGSFPGLQPIQVEAISPILEGGDLIVRAATGSGKSEAVLAPALERVISSGRSRSVLYIIPTRALAKDLMRRFEAVITERLGLTLAIRTGDIKRGGRKRPDIMFTTPESLDVMLGSSNAGIKRFLCRVGIVIIDEVHSLVHHYRGRHLVYLFTRLERRTGEPLQKIAMSATISNIPGVMGFFDFRQGGTSVTARADREILARLLYLKDEAFELPSLLNDLYREWKYRKILIFCNSRSACDRLSGIVRRNGVFRQVTELHYSNLKAGERKRAEDRFRKNSHALCIATSTLELGIDVGDVDAVLLYQPPGSVSAFLQRIGRANRRGETINFWGITSGENAGTQVVRFLALLELGRQGEIETPSFKDLPSVVSQQVISCLYEKREISLNALKGLFPEHKTLLPEIFISLEKKGWLKQTRRPGLIRGGWQYWNHLNEYKIWGNFPEMEKEYLLEVSGESIADIPLSIVSQIKPGDRVYLSGRRLKILKIQEGDPGKVTARSTGKKTDKELVWVGLGAHVSYEAAQAMGKILLSGTLPEESGLMARTRKLFHKEVVRTKKRVTLANGIEVVQGTRARFHFCTFLGSAGNLVLEWAAREFFEDDDVEILSSETGVECSRWIEFEKLDLPLEKASFHAWVSSHFRVLSNLIPLSIFWKTLPREQKVEEVADFLFDRRVLLAFARYLGAGSHIVSGDIAHLGPCDTIGDTAGEASSFEIAAGDSLLEREKNRVEKPDGSPFLFLKWQRPCLDLERPGSLPSLTATMVSEYFFHGRCDRRFYMKYLGLGHPVKEREEVMALARKQGMRHEEAVFEALEKQGSCLAPEPAGPEEHPRIPSLRLMADTVKRMALLDPGVAPPVRLSHCYLEAESPVSGCPKILGIPDLIEVTPHGNGRVLLRAGDIKSSQAPGYHHKWQVAFYALLLEKSIERWRLPALVSQRGFIITPKPKDQEQALETEAFHTHGFDLKPYLAAFPALFEKLGSIISRPPAGADHKLDSRCIRCPGFSGCYSDALFHEEIQFLPILTGGELSAFRHLGCTTLAGAQRELEAKRVDLSPDRREKLIGWCRAFLTNRIFLQQRKTYLFPCNLSRLFFLHLEKDPMTRQPWILGWKVMEADAGTTVESGVLTMDTPRERQEVWETFTEKMERLWNDSIHSGLGPHLFHFGSGSEVLMRLLAGEEPGGLCDFFHQTQPSPWTDLQHLLTTHFCMPAPGTASLHTLGRIFKCSTAVDPPETLFHEKADLGRDKDQAAFQVKKRLDLMAELYQTAVSRLESRWIREWPLNSQVDDRVVPYTNFIREERRLKEAEVMMLQELPLEERMLRFRSMGYLKFDHTRLDDQGRYLFIFKATSETLAAKFRCGDFLKLVPQGMADIQNGFPVIMEEYDMGTGEISLLARSGRINPDKGVFYSLEEELDDWNQEKLLHASSSLFSDEKHFHIRELLAGVPLERQAPSSSAWAEKWLAQDDRGLNPTQQRALMLAFQHRTSMIQGPPGTGKTHLLGWIIIALILCAHDAGTPLRIGISALTHQAIDTVLKKIARLVNEHLPGGKFPGRCVKWGEDKSREAEGAETSLSGNCSGMKVEYTKDAHGLPGHPWLILGGTGYGFYSLFNSKNKGFPLALDWVIFDEASQLPVPQALLSLMYARKNFLFLGDVNQLPPIVMGDYNGGEMENGVNFNESILSNIKDLYPDHHRVTLNTTYRMNKEICAFPSKIWYDNILVPAPLVENIRLCLDTIHERQNCHGRSGGGDPAPAEMEILPKMTPGNKFSVNRTRDGLTLDRILNPEQPVVLVLMEHRGCSQRSDMEAGLMAALACRLIIGHGLAPDQMALITPHRAQNNAILQRLEETLADGAKGNLPLPLVDTVERVQGAERDVILFGLTASHPDHLHNEFLNSPNRLNVAMTRARKKLVIIGSNAFFSLLPNSENLLLKNSCFKQLLAHCRARNAVFYFPAEK